MRIKMKTFLLIFIAEAKFMPEKFKNTFLSHFMSSTHEARNAQVVLQENKTFPDEIRKVRWGDEEEENVCTAHEVVR